MYKFKLQTTNSRSMMTIGESVSRIRNILKGVSEDAFLTDRFIFSILNKYTYTLIRRQDNESKLMKYDSLFEVLPVVDLIEVDKIEADCAGIKTGCKIMRTCEKLPKVFNGSIGPIFRNITSIDGSEVFTQTKAILYQSMASSTHFKYNKNKYYWYKNGYLYFPDITWESVSIEGMFEESTAGYCKEDGDDVVCQIKQNETYNIPDHLFAEIEQMAQQELLMLGKIPSDTNDDSQNILR
jgi:hypothetical protein